MQINGGHSAFDTQFLPPADPLPPEARKGWMVVLAALGVAAFGIWAFGILNNGLASFTQRENINTALELESRIRSSLLRLRELEAGFQAGEKAQNWPLVLETHRKELKKFQAELAKTMAGDSQTAAALREADSTMQEFVIQTELLMELAVKADSPAADGPASALAELGKIYEASHVKTRLEIFLRLEKIERRLHTLRRELLSHQIGLFKELYFLAAVSLVFGLAAVWLLVRVRTSRKRALEAEAKTRSILETVSSNEERLAAIVNCEPECVKTVGLDGTLLDMNAAGLAMIKAESLETVKGKPVLSFIHTEDREIFLKAHEDASKGETRASRFRMLDAKGGLHWMESTSAPLRNQKGEIVSVLSVTRDVTGRIAAEETGMRLSAILEATSDFVSTSDVDGGILYINRAGRALTGIGEKEDLTQRSFADCHPKWAALKISLDGIPTAIEKGIWSGETALLGGDGREIPVSQVIIAHRAADGTVEFLSTVARNIADRKNAERELLESQIRLKLLNTISTGMISGLSVQEVVEQTLEHISRCFEDYRAAYSTIDEGGRLTVLHSRQPEGMPALTGLSADLNGVPAYLEALRARRVVAVSDVSGDGRLAPLAAAFESGGTRAVLDVPVHHSEQLVGLLCFDAPEAHTWSEHEISTLSEVAEYLSLAIKDARMQEERERVQQELVRLASFPELTPSPIIEMDLEGRLTYLNPAAQKQFPALPPLGFKHPMLEGLEPALEKIKSDETSTFFRNIRVDGIVYEEKIYCDSRNRFIRIYAYDITERQQAEQSIRENEERFRKIFSDAPIGMVMVGGDFKLLKVNTALCEMLGYSEPELVGRTFVEITHPEDIEKDVRLAEQVFRGEIPNYKLEKRYLKKNGEVFWINLTATIIRDPAGRILYGLGMVEDISERKRAEEGMARARDAALEQARLKSEFLANMSHEIRTPMNGVLGYLGLLSTRAFADEEEMSDFVQGAKSSADTLLTLINDILDFSKIEAGKLAIESIEFDLRSVVEETASLLAPRAQQKGLELACLVEFGVPLALKGDPTRLRQVLINLTGNAVKFTEKGEVVIRANLVDETDGLAKIRFSVKDTGIGIPPEKQHLLFQSFTQVDGSSTRRHGGTGLGLAISRQLIELMGGAIGFDSAPGKGSEFWFEVALSKNLSVRPRLISADVKNLPVLVVDDNAVNRDILCRMLESFGCRPFSAAGSQEALTILQKKLIEGDPVRLAVIDFQMPEEDGRELAQKIKSNPALRQTALMLLTSVGTRGDAAMAREAGFAAYLHKPVKQSQLLEAIAAIVGRQSAREDSSPPPLITRHWLEEVRRSGTILLAEDNPVNQAVAEAILSRAGYTVVTVKDGREAVEVLSERDFDLVLMDLQMPEMDGLEATAQIRKLPGVRSHIPIIAMTAHALSGDREKCLEAGMNDYISKPINPLELKEMVERWLKRANDGPAGGAAGGVRNPEESPVDFERLRQSSGGDLEFETRLTELFLSDVLRRLNLLDESVSAGKEEKSGSEAHSLKGACANFGAARLAGIFSELEIRSKNGERTEMRRLYGQARLEFKRVKEFLTQKKRVEA